MQGTFFELWNQQLSAADFKQNFSKIQNLNLEFKKRISKVSTCEALKIITKALQALAELVDYHKGCVSIGAFRRAKTAADV